jgi:NTE family protein
VLDREGIPVRAIAGTSIGAEIGAFYASGMSIGEMVRLAKATGRRKTLELFLPDFTGGGLASGKHILAFFDAFFGGRAIEDLEIPFAAVATDIRTGEQVVLDRGRLASAVRASVSIPGLLAPVRVGGRLLIDGGVVNPLPADVARERFGAPVVAVSVHRGGPFGGSLRSGRPPRFRAVVERSAEIVQEEIVRLRLEHAAPDVLIEPVIRRIGDLDFHRGAEALAAGRHTARQALPAIRRALAGSARKHAGSPGGHRH